MSSQSLSISPRMEGTLFKWTNYMSGWQQRWFVLEGGTLAYYLAATEVNQGCRGSFKVTSCDIHVHPTDHTRFDIVMPGGRQVLYLKASSTVERQRWVVALGTSKQEEEGNISKFLGPNPEQQVAMKAKMTELQINCQLLFSQVSNMKTAASSVSPDVKGMEQMSTLINLTCDKFLKVLSECMVLSSTTAASGYLSGGGVIPATPTDLTSPTLSIAAGKPLARVPPDKISKARPLSVTQGPPVILPFPISLPTSSSSSSSLKSHTKKAHPGSLSEQQSLETHSLPVHLVGKTSPSTLSPESIDEGDSMRQKLDGESPSSEARKSKSPLNSSRNHSRANSDAFVTPQSTPTSSPPPSPPPHPPHISSSLAEAHTHLSPQTPTNKLIVSNCPAVANSRRVGDRFPRSTTWSSSQTSFFSRVPHKFEDLVLGENDGVPTPDFLSACRAVIPFFDVLSSTAFAPVKADINGNIEKLSKKYHSDPDKFPTLQSMVVGELEANTHEARNSATDALLWLKRAMEFIQDFMAEVAGGEHSLDIAAGKAYTKCLRKYHNWIVRGMFSMAVRAVPYHKDFLVLLGSDGTPDGNAAVTVHMADFARSLGEINNIINLLYQSHELDSAPLL